MNKSVLIADDVDPIVDEILRTAGVYVDRIEPGQLIGAIRDYNAIVVRSKPTIDNNVIESAPALEIIARNGTGIDNITGIDLATERGIAVINTPYANAEAVAELVIGGQLYLSRDLGYADTTTKQGGWEKKKGSELKGKTVLIVGLGRIGTVYAHKMYYGFGAERIIYSDPNVNVSEIEYDGKITPVTKIDDLEEAFRQADLVSVHVDGRKRVIGYEHIRHLGRDSPAILSNLSRGENVDIEDLQRALSENPGLRAHLDVFTDEYERKIDTQRPLAEFGSRILLTPHTGASTDEAQDRAAYDVAGQLLNYFNYGICHFIQNGGKPDLPDDLLPYFPLAERLAKLGYAFVGDDLSSVQFTCYGDLEEYDVFSRAMIKGIFGSSVTVVNAPYIAESNGIIPVKRQPHTQEYGNHLTVDLVDGNESISLRVTVDDDEPLLLRVGPYTKSPGEEGDQHYRVRIRLLKDHHVAFCEVEDRPGTWIGVGHIPYDGKLNILEGSQYARNDRQRALFAFVLEGNNPGDVFSDLKHVPHPDGRQLNVYRTASVSY